MQDRHLAPHRFRLRPHEIGPVRLDAEACQESAKVVQRHRLSRPTHGAIVFDLH